MTLPKTNNINTNQTVRLSVQISLTGLSFLWSTPDKEVLDFSEKKFLHPQTPEELLWEIEKSLETKEVLKNKTKSITLVYNTPYAASVPLPLFDESKASEYLKFNTKILASDFVSHDIVENQDMAVVYIPFMNINNYFFETFGDFQYFHSNTLLLEHFLPQGKHHLEPKIYVHVKQDQFDCFAIKNGTLLLCSTYPYKTPEDFVYFVLFCYEQLQLNPDSHEILLCGEITTENDLYKLLYTYIRNIVFADKNAMAFNEEPNHFHLPLKLTMS
ncbi:MAG: hypothetical protein CMC74_05610 [Flavobacteriaceae bacterium]|nr:hypothetical protein [Flavobacteriaceae bacterium]|tara:strand:- start:120350 stop:121165 length:816 start_codon:yes stop_codon:yes gene_type:complete